VLPKPVGKGCSINSITSALTGPIIYIAGTTDNRKWYLGPESATSNNLTNTPFFSGEKNPYKLGDTASHRTTVGMTGCYYSNGGANSAPTLFCDDGTWSYRYSHNQPCPLSGSR
jgi:hypothetical protein